MANERMFIGEEVSKLVKRLENQKENLNDFLKSPNILNDKELTKNVIRIYNLYIDVISKLKHSENAIFLRSPFYEDIDIIGKNIDSLEGFISFFFSIKNEKSEYIFKEPSDSPIFLSIESYLNNIVNLLNSVRNSIIISEELNKINEEKIKLDEKVSYIETSLDDLKNIEIHTIFEEDSNKFKRTALFYEIAFYIVILYMFLYFFGWFVDIETESFKFKLAEQFHGNHTPTFYVQKISLLILSTTLAAFLLKRSFMSRRLADEAYRTSKELDALPRYIAGLPIELKDKIRFDLAYKYFGNGIHHESYTGGENLMHENMKANTDFIKAVKDLKTPNSGKADSEDK
ncbi:hypothetical protein [Acinetobacter nosocomialis]|uniref:hypothetical protein n=1 Tax=Acinetobacter nosocomialis TaxID=106654 RepID=UPI002B1BD519|nr:hypothetical protein [Acinetobacter nosocomialis]